MATVQNFNIDDKEKQPDTNQPLGGAPSPSGGGGQAAPQQQAKPAGAVQANAPTSSGRFTNLSKYLQANKGYNAQGGGLAGKVTSKVEQQAQNVQQGLQQGQQQFQQQAEQNRVQYNPNLVQEATQNAAQFAQNQGNVEAFQRLRDASYGGPTSLANEAQLSNQAQRIQNLANLAQREQDRPTLLKQLYKSPSYTAGQQSLDNLLLQSNPSQLQALQKLNPLASNLVSQVQSGEEQARSLAGQYGQEAQQAQASTREALGSAIIGFGQQAQQAVEQAKAQREANYQQAAKNLGEGKVSQADLEKFGLSSGQNLYNLDLNKYLTQSQYTPTLQNIISQDQAAQIGALSNLAGNALGGPASAVLSSFTGPSQAGEYTKQAQYTLDKNRLAQDIAATKSAYEQEYNPAKAQFQATQAALPGSQFALSNLNQQISALEKGMGAGFAQSVFGDLYRQRAEAQNAYNTQQSALNQQQDVLNKLIEKYNPNRQLQVV